MYFENVPILLKSSAVQLNVTIFVKASTIKNKKILLLSLQEKRYNSIELN
jgi:hypothetical protein